MSSPKSRILAVAGALLLLAGVLAADVLVLKDGRRIEGKILEQTATEIRIETRFATLTFARSEVVEIVRSKTPGEVFEERLVAAETATELYELGLWCEEQRLKRESRKAYERALELETDHEGARAKLGFVRYRGEWLQREEREEREAREIEAQARARGLVPFEGRWVRPEDKLRLEQGLVLVEGEWVPIEEAERRKSLAAVRRDLLPADESHVLENVEILEASAGTTFELVSTDAELVGGTADVVTLREIADGLPRGRSWFAASWNAEPGFELYGGRRAEYYVFVDVPPYVATLPKIAERSYHLTAEWVAAAGSVDGFTLLEPVCVSSTTRRNRPLRQLVGQSFHQQGHLLAGRLGYNGRLLPPWYEEGVAALNEQRLTKQNIVFCTGGGPSVVSVATGGGALTQRDFAQGGWRKLLQESIRKGRIRHFDRVAQREFSEMTFDDVAVSMAVIEWLESRGEGALARFHAALRDGAPPSPQRVIRAGQDRLAYYDQAFMAAVDLDSRRADKAWREWFLSL